MSDKRMEKYVFVQLKYMSIIIRTRAKKGVCFLIYYVHLGQASIAKFSNVGCNSLDKNF